MNRAKSCPLCGSPVGQPLLMREHVPVLVNRPYESPEAAAAAPVGRFELAFCRGCEFGFNASFDPALAKYGEEYENEQGHSAAFRAHMDFVVERLLAARGGRTGPVVEIGCGQGECLRRLAARAPGPTRLFGIDPTCRAALDPQARLVWIRSTLEQAPRELLPRDAALAYSRHVIEHVPDPVGFLRAWAARGLAAAETAILLETPSLEWIVQERAFVDLVYEHCNYFTARSLAILLRRAGLGRQSTERMFGGQYWLARGERGAAGATEEPRQGIFEELARFASAEPRLAQQWAGRVRELAAGGRVALWGAGAKGVTLANLLLAAGQRVDCMIDVNPLKQGRFLAVCGAPIVSPEEAAWRGVGTAVVLNPNYLSEIRATVAALARPIEILPFVHTDEIHH